MLRENGGLCLLILLILEESADSTPGARGLLDGRRAWIQRLNIDYINFASTGNAS